MDLCPWQIGPSHTAFQFICPSYALSGIEIR